MTRISAIALAAGLLAGCEAVSPDAQPPVTSAPVYRGIETRLMQDDLVNFHVEMTGARDAADVEEYARCAAAQYALIRGYGFAQHVRTRVTERRTIWQGDAVYLISSAMPGGVKTIDAEVTVTSCRENGIPTV